MLILESMLKAETASAALAARNSITFTRLILTALYALISDSGNFWGFYGGSPMHMTSIWAHCVSMVTTESFSALAALEGIVLFLVTPFLLAVLADTSVFHL